MVDRLLALRAEDSDLQPSIASYLVVPYFAVLYILRRRKGEKVFVFSNDEFAPLSANSEAVTMIVAAAASAAAKATGYQIRTSNGASELTVDPMAIEEIYNDFIILQAKEAEVEYRFARCAGD